MLTILTQTVVQIYQHLHTNLHQIIAGSEGSDSLFDFFFSVFRMIVKRFAFISH